MAPTEVTTTTEMATVQDSAQKSIIVDLDMLSDTMKSNLVGPLLDAGDVASCTTILQSIKDESILGNLFTTACRDGDDSLVKLMIDCNVDVNIRDSGNGSTGLMWAAQASRSLSDGPEGSRHSTVSLLLTHGADALLTSRSTCKIARGFCLDKHVIDILKDAEKTQEAAKAARESDHALALEELRIKLLADRDVAIAEIRDGHDIAMNKLNIEHAVAIGELRAKLNIEQHKAGVAKIQDQTSIKEYICNGPVCKKTPDGSVVLVNHDSHGACHIYFRKHESVNFVELQ